MTLTTIGWVLVYSGLIGLAAIGLCRVIDLAGFWLAVLVDRWDRRADRDIRAHIDQAVDGHHDQVSLNAAERAVWHELQDQLTDTP